jgi:hypothetical protein
LRVVEVRKKIEHGEFQSVSEGPCQGRWEARYLGGW